MGKCSQTDYTEELQKAKKEAKDLREQNKTLNRRGQHQQEEIRRLNEVSHDLSSWSHFINNPLSDSRCFECLLKFYFYMSTKALEEALQTAQPLDVSSETLRDIWKHQVSFGHHTLTFLHTLCCVLSEVSKKIDLFPR